MRPTHPRSVRSTVTPFRNTVFVLLALILAPWQPLPAQDGARRAGGGRRAITALKVGVVHPVSGPAIENGVILIRGTRILGVGPADKVRIPQGAKIEEFPDAHAYPGLVDALSTAFVGTQEMRNSSLQAGTDFADALDPSDEASRELIRYGITTAYVSNRSGATWRGLGAIIRPNSGGFSLLRDKQHGGVSLRMTTGDSAGHALDRLKRFDSTGNVFDSLEAYEKQQADYKKALEEYEKAYAKYLAHYQKSKPTPTKKATAPAKKDGAAKKIDPKKDAGKTTPPTRTPGEQRRRGEGGRRGTGGRRGRPTGAGTTASKTASAQDKKPQDKKAQDKKTGAKSGKAAASAPKKPKWPKRVKKDDAKEALLKVANGDLPLRVEVHRPDEIRAALFMAVLKELPGITLEFASDGAAMTKEIAESGASVVLTDLLPSASDIERNRDRGALPAKLFAAGVPVAIASGSSTNARNLTMIAAYACGRGLPEEAAVRAITQTAAEILGIDDRVGSLARNKLADILITSGPLLRSDTKVVRVIAQGRTQYEAK